MNAMNCHDDLELVKNGSHHLEHPLYLEFFKFVLKIFNLSFKTKR